MSISAAAAAGAGAGAAAAATRDLPPAYPLPPEMTALCCEFLLEEPSTILGLLTVQQDASSGAKAKARYCFKTYVVNRLRNLPDLTDLSKRKFTAETTVYATQRADFELLDRCLNAFQGQSRTVSLCEFAGLDVRTEQFARACKTRALTQLRTLNGRDKFEAFQRLKITRMTIPANTSEALVLRYLEDADFTTSVLSSIYWRNPSGKGYVESMRVRCVAAACCNLRALTFLEKPDTVMPVRAEERVNAALRLPTLKARLEGIDAIFTPQFLLEPTMRAFVSPDEDLYGNARCLEALLKENRVPVEDLPKIMQTYPQLSILTVVFAHPPFIDPTNRERIAIDPLLKVAASSNEWESVFFLIQQAKKLGLPLKSDSIRAVCEHAIGFGNAAAVEQLMQEEPFKKFSWPEVYELTAAAVESGCVGTTFPLLYSPQMRKKSEFHRLLLRVHHPSMLKMFMDDERFAQLSAEQFLPLLLLHDNIPEEFLPLLELLVSSPLFKTLNVEQVEEVFRDVVNLKHFNILKATNRLEELPVQAVYHKVLIHLEHTTEDTLKLVKALFLTSQFSRFEVGQLNAVYAAAVASGNPQLVAAFIASSRFQDVDAITLGKELVNAVKAGNVEIVRLMAAPPHLRKISAHAVVDALQEVKKLENKESGAKIELILKTLVPS